MSLKDWYIENGVLKKYTGHDTILKIPKGVKKIDWDFFNPNLFDGEDFYRMYYTEENNLNQVKSIFLPETIEEIGDLTFKPCRANEITIYSNLNLEKLLPK